MSIRTALISELNAMHRPECADALAAAHLGVAGHCLYVGETAELGSARGFYQDLFQEAAFRSGIDLDVLLAPFPDDVECCA